MYICYQWTCNANNKKYVGVTKTNLQSRWSKHCYDAKNESPLLFHRAIRKYGRDGFSGEVLANRESLEDILVLENKFIKEHNTLVDKHGYNLTTGGEYPHISEELRKYLSIKAKQRPPVTNETKRKLSKSLMGNTNKRGTTVSTAARIKISKALKGTTQPESVKAKHRGKNHFNVKTVIVNDVVYDTIREAGLKLDIPYGTLYNRIKNTNGKFDKYRLVEV